MKSQSPKINNQVIAGIIDTSVERHIDTEAMYQFTHVKTGKKYITQNWAEYHAYQSNSDWYQNYQRLGTIDVTRAFSVPWAKQPELRNVEDKINRFWAGAKGYEKYGSISCIGICGIPIRWFLKKMRNHAAMVGDKDLYHKAIADDQWWWHNGRMSQLALPPHTQEAAQAIQ